MNKQYFRRLILLYIVVIVASLVAAFTPGGYSQALSDAIDNEPSTWLVETLWGLVMLVVPLAIAAVAGIYGLYQFRRWGRTLSLYSTGAGLLLYPFMGPNVSGGVETALFEASTLMWGALLALAYYSPIASEFSEPAPS
jgi:hypothetical protein